MEGCGRGKRRSQGVGGVSVAQIYRRGRRDRHGSNPELTKQLT